MSPNLRQTASKERKDHVLLAACGVSLIISLVVLAQDVANAGPLRFDDAYMFIRYSRHFLNGLGHAWNPDGMQTYGNTSLLHFFVVLALRASLPFRDEVILRLASISAGLSAIAVLSVAAARLTPPRLLQRPASAGLPFCSPISCGGGKASIIFLAAWTPACRCSAMGC